jgi:hypothetical protein
VVASSLRKVASYIGTYSGINSRDKMTRRLPHWGSARPPCPTAFNRTQLCARQVQALHLDMCPRSRNPSVSRRPIILDGDISNPEHTGSIRLTPDRTRAGRDASMNVSGARYVRGMINVPRFHRSKLKMVRPLTGTIHHICLYGLR